MQKEEHHVSSGHVPDSIRASEASNAGQKSFEHLIGIFEGSSTAEDEMLKGPRTPGKFLETYDPTKEAALIALLAKNQTWQCPTLYWERGAVAGRCHRREQRSGCAIRSGLLAREDMAAVYGIDHQGARHGSVARAGKVRGARTGHCAETAGGGCSVFGGTDTPAGVDVVPGYQSASRAAAFRGCGIYSVASAADCDD